MYDFYMFEQNDSWICPRWYNLKRMNWERKSRLEINYEINWLNQYAYVTSLLQTWTCYYFIDTYIGLESE